MAIKGDKTIFGGKKFSELLEDIYNHSIDKKQQIDGLIKDLANVAKNAKSGRTLDWIIPYAKEYLDISVKNDENLVKLAQIIQRAMASEIRSVTSISKDLNILTEKEKEQLLSGLSDIKNTQEQLDNTIKKIPKITP